MGRINRLLFEVFLHDRTHVFFFMMINSDALPTKTVRRITRSIIIMKTDTIGVFCSPLLSAPWRGYLMLNNKLLLISYARDNHMLLLAATNHFLLKIIDY
jgi:hypothetical protein